jgi:dolichol-phosphate mannosyltransferase
MRDVLLLIPTLDEEAAIEALLSESSTIFPRILVVDGFSEDRTREIAARSGAQVILQRYGKGKGCGVRTGLEEFLNTNANYLAIIDGDGTNVPADLEPLVQAVASQSIDVALGSRTRGKRDPGSMDWLTISSNRVVSFLLGARFLRFFTDVQTGYWVLSRSAVAELLPLLKATKFEAELELFVRAMQSGFRVAEFPVRFRSRTGRTKFSFALRMRNLAYAFRLLFFG